MNYQYFEGNNKVVCVSTFAGKPVRGVAKCDVSSDYFDIEVGKKLATARCDCKINHKRVNSAKRKLAEALKAEEYAKERVEKMRKYLADSTADYDIAELNRISIENSLK